ncbi:hypothetical protein COT64_00595 [Candidatus Shapirobacteria bacterium CG09_land_8_20_14_0_10_39_12]|uniref:Uncharacterized protein n=2 Tax=Candidatus Shapironibacteriota TaxID=1752721 RepID=A0A2M8L521_9BACT|nr:MAG: hypothetical protein COT64_00595 [Candidatus Shapirobacteria bacterium CG09_land_8_20_14_0_10_39_12]PJE68931.1 MAG: hypothetical protein COU96_02540 [Candidatus Shapirobacteria bacterium CG10_big_fil_rev_8_21_14_0_10_38_14]
MKLTEPQFIYMLLVLPTLFGLTLVAEGLNKILQENKQGWISLIFGAIFIAIVVLAYLFFWKTFA